MCPGKAFKTAVEVLSRVMFLRLRPRRVSGSSGVVTKPKVLVLEVDGAAAVVSSKVSCT